MNEEKNIPRFGEEKQWWILSVTGTGMDCVYNERIYGNEQQLRKVVLDRVNEDRDSNIDAWVRGTETEDKVYAYDSYVHGLYAYGVYQEYRVDYMAAPEKLLSSKEVDLEESLKPYWFTFGTDPCFPYENGSVCVYAPSKLIATYIFREKYPNKSSRDVLNCAFVYDEPQFRKAYPYSIVGGKAPHDYVRPDYGTDSLYRKGIVSAFRKVVTDCDAEEYKDGPLSVMVEKILIYEQDSLFGTKTA